MDDPAGPSQCHFTRVFDSEPRMSHDELLALYAAGPERMLAVTADLTREQSRLGPIPGLWSTLQCVCHVADFEVVYADRIKRVLAEEQPTLFGGDPDTFAAGLAYDQRDLQEELALIAACRRQVHRILRSVPESAWQRTGMHSEAGPLTLRQLVEGITGHIPHHAEFIRAKRQRLGL